MRFALVLLAAVAAAAAMPQEVYDQRNERIVGGYITSINQYPYSAALLAHEGATTFSQACGGTIINNRAILTAAHCFHSIRLANQWRSRMGSTWSNSGGRVMYIQSIIRHPNYDPNTEDNDFAVLRMFNNIYWSNTVSAGSIAGANYNLGDNQVVWAIGWGSTYQRVSPSTQLRHVQIWTVNQAVCRERYATRNLAITDNMLCAGWLDVGGRDQCQGDSGGPLLHNNVVVGVRSWGIGCAQAFFPGVNARVSSASNWIVANAESNLASS